MELLRMFLQVSLHQYWHDHVFIDFATYSLWSPKSHAAVSFETCINQSYVLLQQLSSLASIFYFSLLQLLKNNLITAIQALWAYHSESFISGILEFSNLNIISQAKPVAFILFCTLVMSSQGPVGVLPSNKFSAAFLLDVCWVIARPILFLLPLLNTAEEHYMPSQLLNLTYTTHSELFPIIITESFLGTIGFWPTKGQTGTICFWPMRIAHCPFTSSLKRYTWAITIHLEKKL